MKGQPTLALILLIFLCCCEFRWEDAAKANEPPQLYFLERDSTTNLKG